MSEFGDSLPKSKSTFKPSVYGKKRFDPGESSSRRLTRFEKVRKELEEDESEFEELEALFAKRLPRGSGKYEKKLPFKCFACNKIDHFASRCLERVLKPNPNRTRVQKKCYYVQEVVEEGVTDDESDKGSTSGNEWVFIAIKEDLVPIESASYVNVERALDAQVEEKDEWVIDSGCSHHMTGDKSKFISMERYEGGIVKFGDNSIGRICGRGSISLDGKNNTNDVLYVEGLKHNLLIVG